MIFSVHATTSTEERNISAFTYKICALRALSGVGGNVVVANNNSNNNNII